MKVLLAIDGSVYSDAAVAEVARRPWPSQSEVKVITVVEMPLMPAMDPWPVSPAYFEHLVTTLRNAGQSVIDSALKTLKDAGQQSLDVTSEMTQGPPAQAILEEAEKWGADLIVMGSRGLGTFNRLLLGSVSNTVVHHAKCSVEIVRSARTDSTDTD